MHSGNKFLPMSHPYFFVDKNSITPDSVLITGEDFSHLVRVLRARVGDVVEISDNETKRYKTVLAGIKKDEALLQIKQVDTITKKSYRVSLFMCLLKKEAMELAIQKTAEIGVDRIIPVLSARTVVEIEGKKTKDKIFRWQQIALGASKQCKRDFICEIAEPIDAGIIDVAGYNMFFLPVEDLYRDERESFAPGLKGAISSLKDIAKALNDKANISSGMLNDKTNISAGILNDKANISAVRLQNKNFAADSGEFNVFKNHEINSIAKCPYNNEAGAGTTNGPNPILEIAYIVGPEGGFEKKEVLDLVKKGAVPVNFGTNILRAETASIYFISILDYLLKVR
jgi:RsmE family RNA methyltransferase